MVRNLTEYNVIVGALLARNEADRYLQRVLDHNAQFCDQIVVLDDGSTDETAAICDAHPKVTKVERGESGGWWGGVSGEAPARARLWQLAADAAGPNGWVLVFDADMLLRAKVEDLRWACTATVVNSWAWPLWDCWNTESTMRVDSYWRGHETPRVWLARALPVDGYVPHWNKRKIHVGHLPENYPIIAGVLPDVAWQHLAYVKPEDRQAKAAQYLALA